MVLLVAYKCSKIMFAVPSAEINTDKWRNMTVSGVGSSSRERVRTPVIEGLDLNMTVGGVGSSSTERVRTPVLEGLDLNLTVSGVGSSSRDRVRNPVLGLDLNLPICSPEPSSVLPLVVYGGTPEPSRSTVDRRAAPDYEAMIFEALSTIEDPNGLDVTAILNFIEERYELPQNFRRSVSSKLRRLVLAGELEKVGNRYKYKTSGQEDVIPMNVENINDGENEEDEIGKETPEDAAKVLAYMIAKAEHMEQAATNACKEADRLAELLEESVVMLKIAEEIHERCSREGFVVLNL